MEAHSVHTTIERVMKKRVINLPSEYIDVCKNTRKNPRTEDVMFLDHKFFKRFDNV